MDIEEKNVIQAYLNATESQQSLLRAIFPTIDFEAHKTPQKPSVFDRIKTFEDACLDLGGSHPLVKQFTQWSNASVNNDEGTVEEIDAYFKLRIIAQALNEGWMPDYSRQIEDELFWAPKFALYRTEELFEMTQEEMNEKHIKMLDGYEAGGYYDGIGCDMPTPYSGCAYNGDSVMIGHALLMKSADLAQYFAHQFIEIWMDYLLPRTNK